MAAGAVMELLIGSGGTNAVGSMAINERITLISNVIAIAAALAVGVAAKRGRREAELAISGGGRTE